MIFKFELPVSVNNLYGHKRGGGVYKKAKGKAWENEAMKQIMIQRLGQKKPHGDRFLMMVTVFLADKRRHDLDNLMKQLQDVLVKKEIIPDDNLIEEIHIYKRKSTYKENYLTVEIQ